MSILSNAERQKLRMEPVAETLSPSVYNLALGGFVFYGFLINAFMVYVLGDKLAQINAWVFLILYFVCCIAGSLLARSRKPILSFIGYNLIVVPIGVLLCLFLPAYSMSAILPAIMVTGGIAAVMTLLSTLFPNIFLRMGRGLFISLIVGLIGQLIASLFGYAGGLFNWGFVILFSLYLGFDWARAQRYPKTLDNAIDSAIDIYLDLINIFIRLVEIFGKRDS